MRILITNDDGISALGLEVLARNVERWIDEAPADEVREAIVVAPSENHSGMSSAVGDVFTHPSVHYERRSIPGAESLVAYSSRLPGVVRDPRRRGQLRVSTGPDSLGYQRRRERRRSVLHSARSAPYSPARNSASRTRVSVQWGENVHYDTAGEVAIEVLQN